ncbi:MAG: PadR family transcriptional regulator [Bryobacteraceae bacterium]|nr:PadR family transcriptional regulator [Bryobacteraceae bacterium]MCO5350105.1 PadR family transcriptional regulator [Bryobacteraceae bacterium]
MIVNDTRKIMPNENPLAREILLSFWKVHILHHAAEGPVYGQWVLEELRRHGYDLSPGTLYPLLRRMERHGWLKAHERAGSGKAHARREYRLTPAGRKVLKQLRSLVVELHHEVVEEHAHAH